MKKVILTKGLPASGKSTWAKDLITEEKGRWVRVNKDNLRAMCHNSQWSKSNEKFVLALRDHIILEALKTGKHVIVDDTNLHHRHFERIRQLVKGDAVVEYNETFLKVSVDECIRRDLVRPNSVGAKVIRRMHRQFLEPAMAQAEYDLTLPDCVIADMDGTLALLNGRSPYNATTCDRDLPNIPVIETVLACLEKFSAAKGKPLTLVIFSGREAVSDVYEKTALWVSANVVERDRAEYPVKIHLRAERDMRKDAVVKREMYERYVKGIYNVRAVFDDRNQVVELWRSLGLTTFQVADGDF